MGAKDPALSLGEGGLRSAPRNVCDSALAWSLFASVRPVCLFATSAGLLSVYTLSPSLAIELGSVCSVSQVRLLNTQRVSIPTVTGGAAVDKGA